MTERTFSNTNQASTDSSFSTTTVVGNAALVCGALAVALLVTCLIALALGRQSFSTMQMVQALWSDQDTAAHAVLWQIRIPRIALAAATGASLAISGAVFQIILRNPLVSPDVLGVASGAAAGAVVALLLSASLVWVQLGAWIGGVVAVVLVLLAAQFAHNSQRVHDQVLNTVLIGIAFAGLFSALVALAKTIADPSAQLPAITFWLLGSFANATLWPSLVLLIGVMVATLLLQAMAWRIDVVGQGEEAAVTMGLDIKLTRFMLIGLATVLTASAVALCGMVGWVGLLVPHMARLLVGPRSRVLLPCAALLGALVCVVVDLLARTLTVLEIAPGVLTAVIGAPLFVWLLWRVRV